MSLKPLLSISTLAALAAMASLVACASPPGGQHRGGHHFGQSADTTAAGTPGAHPVQGAMMGGGMAGGQAGCGMMGGASAGNQAACPADMQRMNKEDMCAMYRSMRDAPNEQARQAMMDRHMPGMAPEMRQRNMEMMRQQCQ